MKTKNKKVVKKTRSGRTFGSTSCVLVKGSEIAKIVNALNPDLEYAVHRNSWKPFGVVGVPFSATINNVNKLKKSLETIPTNPVSQVMPVDLNTEVTDTQEVTGQEVLA